MNVKEFFRVIVKIRIIYYKLFLRNYFFLLLYLLISGFNSIPVTILQLICLSHYIAYGKFKFLLEIFHLFEALIDEIPIKS